MGQDIQCETAGMVKILSTYYPDYLPRAIDDAIRQRHAIKLPRQAMEPGDPRWIGKVLMGGLSIRARHSRTRASVLTEERQGPRRDHGLQPLKTIHTKAGAPCHTRGAPQNLDDSALWKSHMTIRRPGAQEYSSS
jgi:hypothetical protein